MSIFNVTQSMSNVNGVITVTNNKGKFVIEPPTKGGYHCMSQVNNRLFCDGYEYDFDKMEWVKGKVKSSTHKSWWRKIFRKGE